MKIDENTTMRAELSLGRYGSEAQKAACDAFFAIARRAKVQPYVSKHSILAKL